MIAALVMIAVIGAFSGLVMGVGMGVMCVRTIRPRTEHASPHHSGDAQGATPRELSALELRMIGEKVSESGCQDT